MDAAGEPASDWPSEQPPQEYLDDGWVPARLPAVRLAPFLRFTSRAIASLREEEEDEEESDDNTNYCNLQMDAAGAPASDGPSEQSSQVYFDGDDDEEPTPFSWALRMPPARLPASVPAPILRFSSSAIASLRELQEEEDEESNDDTNYCKRARVRSSSEAIQGLQVVTPGDAKLLQAECAVCLKDFDAEEKLRAMPCSHAFHQQCIFDWLRRNRACPLCRDALPAQQPDDDEEEEEN
ncbi:hypothetical protein EJB05_29530, partial [Eragrostis curvula]